MGLWSWRCGPPGLCHLCQVAAWWCCSNPLAIGWQYQPIPWVRVRGGLGPSHPHALSSNSIGGTGHIICVPRTCGTSAHGCKHWYVFFKVGTHIWQYSWFHLHLWKQWPVSPKKRQMGKSVWWVVFMWRCTGCCFFAWAHSTLTRGSNKCLDASSEGSRD